MHISEPRKPSDSILTKCSKMTEDGHKIHGMNGNNTDGVLKDESSRPSYAPGGRLKFFKDGKFILELERAREGERVSWVSVPRKTFWPPQGTAPATYRQESSASLSVSDDNSSIQSSPWQRDHSWKQANPRRNVWKGSSFLYVRPKRFRRPGPKSRKRLRPHSTTPEPPQTIKTEAHLADGGGTSSNEKRKSSRKTRVSLVAIVQGLADRCARTSPARACVEQVVSPRKRFLRVMEKDAKHAAPADDVNNKRSRGKASTAQPLPAAAVAATPVAKTTTAVTASPVRANGVKTSTSSSYSITSLLSDDRNSKWSPNSSPSHYNALPVAQAQYCAAPPPPSTAASDDRWYSESVDRLRTMELSQADKASFPPYPHHSYLPPYLYSYPLPPYYNAGIYGRNYMGGSLVPPMYHHHTPSLSVSSRQEVPPANSWRTEPPSDSDYKNENISDMPLNLSKHAE